VSAGPAQVFVYYRVRAADAAEAIAAAQACQARLRLTLPGLACTLSRRAEDAGEHLTLMETYAHAGGVAPAGQRDIERQMRAAIEAWLIGERHIEVFVPCA
jgi:Domain of unknown function (DUF4936)